MFDAMLNGDSVKGEIFEPALFAVGLALLPLLCWGPAWIRVAVRVSAGYLLLLSLPSLLLKRLSKRLGGGLESCSGLPGGGRLIGYAERSLVYLAFLMAWLGFVARDTVVQLISYVIAGKAIFRFPAASGKGQGGGRVDARACAEWYIFGTFASLALAVFISMLAVWWP